MVFTESLQQTLGGESLKRLQDEKSDHVSFQPYPGGLACVVWQETQKLLGSEIHPKVGPCGHALSVWAELEICL